MNIGKQIQELRKQKGIKQEELAAELGVTAAAVSKWENGYTLPDILMLCALADFFEVTTDELLGRKMQFQYAVIASDLPDLGNDIERLAKTYGYIVKAIYSDIRDAREAVIADPSISHILASFSEPLDEAARNEMPKGTRFVEVHSDNGEVLDGFELYFKNVDTLNLLSEHKVHTTKHSN